MRKMVCWMRLKNKKKGAVVMLLTCEISFNVCLLSNFGKQLIDIFSLMLRGHDLFSHFFNFLEIYIGIEDCLFEFGIC